MAEQLAADIITPVQLPEQLDGVTLVWSPWEIAPVLSHVPNDCEHCDYDGPPAMAEARSPDRLGLWFAYRCRRCQATRVGTFQHEPGRFPPSYVEVWSSPPQPYRATDPV